MPPSELLLIAASVASPLALVWVRGKNWFPADRFKLWFSAGMWTLTGADLYALQGMSGLGAPAVGLKAPVWGDVAEGVVLGIIGLVLAGGLSGLSGLSGRRPPSTTVHDVMAKLAVLPLWARVSVLITVAVTEEVLFRIVPLQAAALGGVSSLLVAGLGLAAFVLAHFQWGRSHVLFVTVVGGFLTCAFLLFRNPWANITAHALIDSPPLLLSGMMLRKMARHSTPGQAAPT